MRKKIVSSSSASSAPSFLRRNNVSEEANDDGDRSVKSAFWLREKKKRERSVLTEQSLLFSLSLCRFLSSHCLAAIIIGYHLFVSQRSFSSFCRASKSREERRRRKGKLNRILMDNVKRTARLICYIIDDENQNQSVTRKALVNFNWSSRRMHILSSPRLCCWRALDEQVMRCHDFGFWFRTEKKERKKERRFAFLTDWLAMDQKNLRWGINRRSYIIFIKRTMIKSSFDSDKPAEMRCSTQHRIAFLRIEKEQK